MQHQRLTKDALKNHWHYGKWAYIIIALCTFFLGSMAFDMTRYQSPRERTVEFQVVTVLPNTIEAGNELANALLPAGQAYDPALEEVTMEYLMFSGDAESDPYGVQKYVTYLHAGVGSVYILPKNLMEQLVALDGAMELDSYIESGVIKADGLDLSACTLPKPDEDGNPTDELHVYAIPISDLQRLKQPDIGINIDNMYMAMLSSCPNPDTAAFVMQLLRDASM